MLQAYLVDLCILAKLYMLWPNNLAIATAWVPCLSVFACSHLGVWYCEHVISMIQPCALPHGCFLTEQRTICLCVCVSGAL